LEYTADVQYWLLRVLVGASLFVLVAAPAMWIESYVHPSLIEHVSATLDFMVVSEHGQVYTRSWPAPRMPELTLGWRTESGSSIYVVESVVGPSTDHCSLPFVPAIIVAAGILGGLWFRQALHRLKERQLAGAAVCVRCGYDLRATPDRCPECGHSPGAAE
jgi:hypothetical protein